MRTHLTYIAIIIIIAAMVFGLFKWGQAGWSEAQRNESNVQALRQDTATKAAIIRVTRNELSELFPHVDSLKSIYEKAERQRITEIRNLKYQLNNTVKGRIDTVYYFDTLLQVDTFKQALRFEHGCLKTEVIFDSTGTPHETLTGDIEQTTYVSRYRPKWFEYLYKFKYWNKDNRPTKVETKNNCNFKIKENIIFEIE